MCLEGRILRNLELKQVIQVHVVTPVFWKINNMLSAIQFNISSCRLVSEKLKTLLHIIAVLLRSVYLKLYSDSDYRI
jgi:hypothetical protein